MSFKNAKSLVLTTGATLLGAVLLIAGCDSATTESEISNWPPRLDTPDLGPTVDPVDPPQPTELNGVLAFVSERDGNPEIYSLDLSGGSVLRLTSSAADDSGPAWSPDGNQIAFSRVGANGPGLHIMDADGSNGDLLIDHGSQPAWSFDGSQIVYTSGHSLKVRPTSQSASSFTIVDRTQWNAQPAWSPDGLRIAFTSDWAAYDIASDVYVTDLGGTQITPVTLGFGFPLQNYLHPVWSPDGSQLAVLRGDVYRRRTDGVRQPWVDGSFLEFYMLFTVSIISPDGTFVKDLAWAGDIAWRDLLDPGSLSWSPDGLMIAYTFVDCNLSLELNDCNRPSAINYVSVDGTQSGTLVADGRDPSWHQ